MEEIANILVDNIQAQCRCGFTRDHISNQTFHCTPQAVTYNATIHGTAISTSLQLMSYILRWIAEETAAFTLHQAQVHLSVEASCTTQVTEAMGPKKDQNQVLLFGVITSGLAAFILASAVIVLVVLLVRKKHHAESYNIDNDVYDRSTIDYSRSVHKQKILNVPAYENIKLQNANKSGSERFEFTKCTAYEDTLIKEKD